MDEKKSRAIASRGVHTASDFCELMSALMSDILDESITPEAANATCKAGANLLKMVELRLKYGGEGKESNELQIANGSPRKLSQNSGSADEAGLIKCNQCDEKVSPKAIGDHKRLKHAVMQQ